MVHPYRSIDTKEETDFSISLLINLSCRNLLTQIKEEYTF